METPASGELIVDLRKARTSEDFTEEWRNKLSIAQTGKQASESARANMSASQKARWDRTPKEDRPRNTGYRHTEEAKAKMAEAQKARWAEVPAEERSSNNYMLGRQHSEEARAKMSSAVKAHWATLPPGQISHHRLMFASKEELYRMRIEEGKSPEQIAEHFGLSLGCITGWLQRFEIKFDEGQIIERRLVRRAKRCKPYVVRGGYIMRLAPTHPCRNKDGYVFEHRIVMEDAIGRLLFSDEVVHHMNFIRADNRLVENLLLLPSDRAHASFHKWLGLIGAHAIGHVDNAPAAFTCGSDMFYRGQWVQEIACDDLKSLSSATA